MTFVHVIERYRSRNTQKLSTRLLVVHTCNSQVVDDLLYRFMLEIAHSPKLYSSVLSSSHACFGSHTLERQHVLVDATKKRINTTLTCVACHPTDLCIATGVANGEIVLW